MLAVAFVLRLAWAVSIPVIPVSDSVAYDSFARVLTEYGVYGWKPEEPSAYWPVGTSAIYGLIYLIFGHHFTPIVVLNIALGVGIVALTMWLGRVFFDSTTAIIAGALMAIWPSQVFYVTILGSELPFTFLVMLGVAAWSNQDKSTSYRALSSGLVFAGAAYVRPVALLLPIVLWLSALPSWQKLRQQFPTMVVAMFAMAIIITPWAARNTKLFGHFVLLSTNGGVTLWMGNNPLTDGGYMPDPAFVAPLNEYERDRVLGDEAKRYIVEHPVAFVIRSFKKAILLHLNETIAVHWNAEGIKQRMGEGAIFPFKLLTQGYWTSVLLLGLGGLGIMLRERGVMRTLAHPVVLIWAYFTGVYAVIIIQDRYHFPSQPFIAMLAAVAILFAARRVRPAAIGAEA